jgi:hypothetical protein
MVFTLPIHGMLRHFLLSGAKSVSSKGFEPLKLSLQVPKTCAFDHSATSPYKQPEERILTDICKYDEMDPLLLRVWREAGCGQRASLFSSSRIKHSSIEHAGSSNY